MTSFQHMLSAGLKKISNSPHKTKIIGHSFAKQLRTGDVVCFFGDLGTGKTTLIKGIASTLAGLNPHTINSPTFTYLHIYEGKVPIYHFDLYRLKTSEDFLSRGFDEYLNGNGICLIEWAERIQSILPKNVICVQIKHLGDNQRELDIINEKNDF